MTYHEQARAARLAAIERERWRQWQRQVARADWIARATWFAVGAIAGMLALVLLVLVQ